MTSLSSLVKQRLDKGQKVVIKIESVGKSWEQLAYLHSTVLPLLTEALFDSGDIERKTERYAYYWLKREMKFGEFLQFGDSVIFDPSSFRDATIDDLILAIDTAIHAAEQRGVFIPQPKLTTNNKGKNYANN